MERSKKRSLAQTPAPTKDKIYGSKVNKKGSASSESNAESIKLSDAIVSVLEGKMEEHNAEYPNRKVTLAVLKAVFRRGAGAYSRSHRPTISGGKPNSRTAWAYARVNKFLEKKAGKQVKKAYIQDDDLIGKYAKGGLIAPNGKKSNLTPEQYKLVRTKAFKDWFGDWENDPENASKVVDENGEPMVVYHGTDAKFNVFDKSFIGSNFKLDKIGFFFTSRYDYANMSRPSYPQKSKFRWTDEDKIKAKSGFVISSFLNIRIPLRINEVDNIIYDSGFSAINTFDHNRDLIAESILRLDKDGFILKKEGEYLVVAINPNQIKLADGSNTTFDRSNPDIRFEDGGEVSLNFYNTTPEHAEIYGLKSKSPMFVQNVCLSNKREIKNLEKHAKSNNHDLIFGHIAEKSEPNVKVIKDMLEKAGFTTIEGNNDFYKYVDNDNFELGGEIESGVKVYHGSSRKFENFDRSKLGEATKSKSATFGFFFTDDIETAKSYSRAENWRKVQELLDAGKQKEAEELENLIFADKDPSYLYQKRLFFKNPLVIDADGAMYNDFSDEINDSIAVAIKNSNDVLIIKNLSDNADYSEYTPATHFLVFDESIIKDDSTKKYHLGGDMSKHLAPNGKPSNLNHEQWHLVRTPEFKAWFGDWENDPENASKVVDENGEPLVVYHGTDTKFNSFNKDFIGSNFKLDKIGFFFTSSYDSANMSRTSYPQKSKYRWTEEDKINAKSGFVISSFLNIRNPLRLNEVDNVIYNSGVSAINTFDHNRELIIESIVRLRKDGFILKKEGEYLLIATEPAQIKLADGSNTTFDGSNPDIRYAKGGYLNKDELVSKALLFSPSYWLRRVPFLKAFDVYGNYEAMQSLYFKLFEKPYDVNYYIQDKLFTFKLSPRYILEVEDMENGNIAITLLPKFTIKDFDMPNDRLEEEIEHYEIQFINGFRKTEAELSLTFEVNPTKRDMDEIINKINKHFFWFIEFSEEIGFDVTFERGGLIDPEKAKEILEDGKIRGKKLTDKQRRFFWASAVRKMAQGTLLETRIEDSPLRGKSLKDVSDLREIYQLAEKYKVGSGEIRKEFFKGIEVESEHTKDYGLSAQIALNHLNEDKDYYSKLETLKLEKGGKLEAENNNREIIHNSGNAGGVLVGRRHSEGGIKAINRSTGQPLEMEGGEVVITRNAVSDNEKKEFEGEMLTNREILSRINVSGGGVSFEEGGEIDECGCSGHKYNYGGEVLEDYEIVKRMARGGVPKSVLGNPAFNTTGIQFNWEEFVAEANQFLKDEKARDYSKMNSFILKYEKKNVFNPTQSFTEEWLEDYIVSLAMNTNYKLNKGVIERFVDREIFNNVLQKDSIRMGLISGLSFHSPDKIKKIVKQDIGYHELEFLNDLKDFTSKDQLRPTLQAITTEKGNGSQHFSFVASDAWKLIHFPNVNVSNELSQIIEKDDSIMSLLPKQKGKIEYLEQLEPTHLKIVWRAVIEGEKYVSSTGMNALFLYDLLDRMVFLNDVFSPITKVPIFRYDIDLGLDESYSTSFDPEFLRDIVYFLTKYSPAEKINYPIKFRLKDRSTAMCYVNYAQNDFTEITPAIMSKIIENDYFGIAMPIQSLVSTPEVPFLKIQHTKFFLETLSERTPEPQEEVKPISQQDVKDAIEALKIIVQFSDSDKEIEDAQTAIDALELLLD